MTFSKATRQTLATRVDEWLARPAATIVITLTGAHGVHESKQDLAVRRAHEDADIVLCDGTPPFVAAVIYGHRREVDRIPGRDATAIIANLAAQHGTFQFFLGGPPGLAQQAKQGLEALLNTEVDGDVWSPPFSPSVDDSFLSAIAARLSEVPRPAVVWLGLSTPKQELVAQEMKARFPDGLLIACVGAAFDMYAGTKAPAPKVALRGSW